MLKVQPFTYLRRLPEGGVTLRQRRSVQAVARDIAVRSRLRHYERTGIEVLRRCAGDDFSSECELQEGRTGSLVSPLFDGLKLNSGVDG